MNYDQRKRFEDGPVLATTFFGYIIEHADILNNNKTPFLDFWDVERIAHAGRLHDMFGKVRFAIDGYNSDERELFEIPEVRIFLRELAEEWPYFFYAADLEDRFLDYLIKCAVQTATVIRAPNMPTDWRIAVKPAEVNAVCEKLRVGYERVALMDNNLNQTESVARMEQIKQYVRSGQIQ